jgi:hypothetical protein
MHTILVNQALATEIMTFVGPAAAASMQYDAGELSFPTEHFDIVNQAVAELTTTAIVPESVTRRQFAKQARIAGLITAEESVAMIATATMPAMITALVSQLPEAAQTDAREDFAAAVYLRSDPTMQVFLQLAGFTTAQADAFFIAAKAL